MRLADIEKCNPSEVIDFTDPSWSAKTKAVSYRKPGQFGDHKMYHPNRTVATGPVRYPTTGMGRANSPTQFPSMAPAG